MAHKGTGAVRAAVFASGNGSNAENIIRFAQEESQGRLHIPVVICDKPEAGVLARAARLGVECAVVPVVRGDGQSFQDAKPAQEARVQEILRHHAVDWILLAGYMLLFTPSFFSPWRDEKRGAYRIVNIHPALLPAFPGRDGYGDAWRAGVAESGVTIHHADEGMDTGPVIMQRRFPRLPEDGFEDFKARGMALEHELYREFLRKLIAEETG